MKRAAVLAGLIGCSASTLVQAQAAAPESVLLPQTLNDAARADFNILLRDTDSVEIKQGWGEGAITMRSPVRQASALVVDASRFRDISDKLDQLYISDSKDRPTFIQLLGRRLRGFSIPKVQLNDKATDWTQLTDIISEGEAGSELGRSQKVTAAIIGAQNAGFDVRLSEISKLPDQAAPSGVLSRFFEKYNLSVARFADAILDPTEARQNAFLSTVKPTRDELVRLWPSIRRKGQGSARRDVSRRWFALSTQSSLKAIYGNSSDFLPETYRTIFEQSQRVVGIGPYSSPNCSGAIIGHGWVMTAGHCLAGGWQGIYISIDLGNGVTERVKSDDRWPPEGTGESDVDATDYAFLHIPAARQQDGSALASFLTRLDTQAPFCRRLEPAEYGEPVAVIARHQKDPIKVYDDARVLFPFTLPAQQFAILSVDTGLKLQRFVDGAFETEREREDEFDQRMREFEQAYRPLPDGSYEFRAQRTGFGSPRPYIGMDTDTIHGNSGAPVFSRREPCIVGIFTGGQPDGAIFQESNWSRHEFGTPISEVAADLRRHALDGGSVAPEVASARKDLLSLIRDN